MNDTIAAIYEKGVLRPLEPLDLAEHARVHIRIVAERASSDDERQQVRAALLAAGVIHSHAASEPIPSVSEDNMLEAAKVIGAAGPLSDVIIAARDDR